MKKLTREQMKQVTGGTNKTQWSCYGSSDAGYVETCISYDPTTLCEGCGYSDCVDTGVSCSNQTVCIC